jgi:hypothetical protein
MKTFKLCYIEGNTAYFTTKDIAMQWGDDWNDVPYHCNAGAPYTPTVFHYTAGRTELDMRDHEADGTPKWEILAVQFDCYRLQTPAELSGYNPYSVQMINAGAAAWLFGYDALARPVAIHAGATLDDFTATIIRCGGTVTF